MIKPPADMLPELSEWNNGKGISLENWAGCEGSFQLAVGYSTIYWPQFVLIEDYIVREGCSREVVIDYEAKCKEDKQVVERVLNHLHLDSIQYLGCPDISTQRLIFLGEILREIHIAKLAWQFPDRPCEVEFRRPEDPANWVGYELSFWQKKHERPKESCGDRR